MDDNSSSTKRTVSEWQTLFRTRTPKDVAAMLRGDLALIRMTGPVGDIRKNEVEAITRYTEATVICAFDRENAGRQRVLSPEAF